MPYENLDFLEKKLGYTFDDRQLLHQALTHKSAVNEYEVRYHNESLAWLGQSLLWASTAEILYDNYPHNKEGRLTEKRSQLLDKNRLFSISEQLGLNKDSFLMGNSEQACWMNDEKLQQRIHVKGLEALLGAVFLEKGGDFSCIKGFVAHHWKIKWVFDGLPLRGGASQRLKNLAMTRRAAVNDHQVREYDSDNERLEFLGDALIGAAVSYQLYAHDVAVRLLSEQKNQAINNRQLAQLAVYYKLEQQINLGKEEIGYLSGLGRKRILANCCEAFLAFRYLTQRRTLDSLKAPAEQLLSIKTFESNKRIESNKNQLSDLHSSFFRQDKPCLYAQDYSSSDTEEDDEYLSEDELSNNYSLGTKIVGGLALLAATYGVNKYMAPQQEHETSRSDEDEIDEDIVASEEKCRLM